MATAWIEPAPDEAILTDSPVARAFHSDGEPCERAVTTYDCRHNHRYGRTWEESY